VTPPFTTTVVADLAHGMITVSIVGLIETATVPVIRQTLLKCMAQAPDAVIVDLSRAAVEHPSRLAVFRASLRTAELYHPTMLVLCAPSPDLRPCMASAVLRGVPVFDTPQQAEAAVAAGSAGVRRAGLALAATPAACAEARELTAAACRRWQAAHLVGPATLVVSELVSNAVRHAGAPIEVAVALRGEYLSLSVRDGSRMPPRPVERQPDPRDLAEGGWGLHLVDVCATAWGAVDTSDGKVVWAMLRAVPVGTGRRG
jgi:anti-sigma regulatory factor (Ser/Thr protein kinase)/anti-anti-sigma regulatory factor